MYIRVYMQAKSLQSCPTLCDPMDSSPPDSSVRGDSPDENTGVGSLYLLQRIFLTQELNQGLLYYRQILYQLSHQGSPKNVCTLTLKYFSAKNASSDNAEFILDISEG